MKTIGLVGGITWLSTVEYYKQMNLLVSQRLGAPASAKILLYSVNFAEIKELTLADDWAGIASLIGRAAAKLEQAGADCLLLGANTMHKIAPEVREKISIPLLHVAEATAAAITKKQLTKVALLGTRYTMQLPFYTNILASHGIETIIPGEEDIEYVNNAIYSEMGAGIFLPTTKARFIAIIEKLVAEGAQGVILGCTEIPLLVGQQDCSVPVFDTTFIHACAAVDFALG